MSAHYNFKDNLEQWKSDATNVSSLKRKNGGSAVIHFADALKAKNIEKARKGYNNLRY